MHRPGCQHSHYFGDVLLEIIVVVECDGHELGAYNKAGNRYNYREQQQAAPIHASCHLPPTERRKWLFSQFQRRNPKPDQDYCVECPGPRNPEKIAQASEKNYGCKSESNR
jgi:hypothetical protein